MHLYLHGQAKPVSDRILGKAAIAPLHLLQARAFEHPKMLAAKAHADPVALQARGLQGHPAE